MTAMLASVTDAAEAEAALAGGADVIDLKDPRAGALGAAAAQTVRDVVALVAGRRKVSAAAGDDFASPADAAAAAAALAEAGADYVKIGLRPENALALLKALAPLAARRPLVAVLFADLPYAGPSLTDGLVERVAGAGFKGAMLDTAVKGRGRLLDHMDVAALAAFVARCRAAGLACGLAGSLEPPDAPRLLPLRPDFLGFRGALCAGGTREGRLDLAAFALIRDLIPALEDEERAAADGVDWRLLGRGYAPPSDAAETDRIFVRDFLLPCSIGAYEFERAQKQDVRFNVDVDVHRARLQSDDMRDVFSYDLVTDAIRIIAGRGHIELVETLAREIAESVLRHPAVARVTVRVEKLDVIRGAVGVEIVRERPKGVAALEDLFGSDAEGAGATPLRAGGR
ncbi:(5-formylfuran-3-yl)methyl phosphate synthase [Methylocella sp.]|uniref:(5-formylfuran-3-yl)methyl phosphate synthase n=1 Tax=Methylocella sp. TaxID=1978226 RepID=UPI0037852926